MTEQQSYEARLEKHRQRMISAADSIRKAIETPAHDGTPAMKTVMLLTGMAQAILIMLEDRIEER